MFQVITEVMILMLAAAFLQYLDRRRVPSA